MTGADLGDTEIFQRGGQGEPSLPGLQDGDRLGQRFWVVGEQAPGVVCAGPDRWHAWIDLVSPLGDSGRRLGQLAVPAGQGDADQLRVVHWVQWRQRKDRQALLFAPSGQPARRLAGLEFGVGV